MTERFRPSNGTHGDVFMCEFCFQCIKWPHNPDAKKQCNIALRALAHDIEDEAYPDQWCYQDGKPTCTAFKSREEHNAERRAKRKPVIASSKPDHRTADMFGGGIK